MFQSMPQRCCNTADSSRFRRNTRRSLGLLVAQPTIGHSFPLFSHNPLFFPPNVSLKFFFTYAQLSFLTTIRKSRPFLLLCFCGKIMSYDITVLEEILYTTPTNSVQ
jgi:hypothetical protein